MNEIHTDIYKFPWNCLIQTLDWFVSFNMKYLIFESMQQKLLGNIYVS